MGMGKAIHNSGGNVPGALKADPIWSAASPFVNLKLRLITFGLILGLASAFVIMPARSLQIAGMLLSGFIAAMATLRYLACGLALSRKTPNYSDPDIWPFYTVLVPMRDEAHMVADLMTGLARLDYPPARLEIFMITEADDPATTRAVLKHLTPPFKSIVVPSSLPATKPKALNVAMEQAKGEIITIYDAEDRPDPSQLKAATRALMTDKNMAAVQAPLSYYNANQNWLTRQFTLEYDALFQVWNPMMARIGLPFPLGGTSNHIKREALDRAGLWDPHNVTEDADLAFRLAAQGWTLGTIEPPTGEEALSDYPNWKRQRMRWQKGFLQSWAVHMRRLKGHGWRRALALQITLGATLLAGFLHPPALVGLLTLFALGALGIVSFVPPALFYFIIIFGYGGAILAGAIGLHKSRRLHLWPSLFGMPLYWIWHFWPSILAAIEIFRAPYYWHKTVHGRARLDDKSQVLK